jgi:pentatricopeptide repeat protein
LCIEFCCRFTLSSALSKLATDVSAHDVHALYERHRHNLAMPLDTHVFNAVLSAHATAGDTRHFERVWADMREAGCAPTPASHACRVRLLLASHDSAAVLKFYREMVGDRSEAEKRARATCMVSPHLYTSVFAAVAAGAKESAAVSFPTLWSIWRDMIELGVPLDDQLASSFLAAAKRMDLNQREVR